MAADLMWMYHYEDLQASFGERWLVLGGLPVEESDVAEAMFKKAWETQLVERYSDFLYKMRSTGKKQSLNEMSGEGAGPSQHIDGSISTAEITEKLDYDMVTLIERRAELVRDNYTTRKAQVTASQAQTGEQPTIDEL
ncbi:hypothetical protein JCGZ_08921 [Jatropha curcas]|uniref:Uncharacterized protein n=1 Tax=Jatropha curcas TaxID=180498 RepID=A0A067LHS2_JATCU|nr:hypothetical protein JCGZ_08921 [Jatropha curcas]